MGLPPSPLERELAVRLDRLYDIDFEDVANGALHINTKLTKFSPAAYLGTLAAMFLLVCERLKVDPRRVLETTDRVLRRALDRQPVKVRAVRRWLREEIPDAA